ncbi:MAG: SCO family protein [Candidatus Cybelea sp.]
MKTAFAVALACALLAFGLGLFVIRMALQPHFLGSTPPNVRLPEVTLIDDGGAPFKFSQLHATAYALFFGYTHCQDTCPLTLAKLERARTSLTPEKRRATTIFFVTVDPTRDTPARLHRYMALFGPGLVGLTGGRQALKTLYAALGVGSARIGKGQNYEMGHTDAVFFVDPSGRIRTVHDWHDAQQDLTHDFTELATIPFPLMPSVHVVQ